MICNNFETLLGSAFESASFQACIKAAGDRPVLDDFGSEKSYSFPSTGVSFNFVENHLNSVMLYSGGLDGFSRFPFGLPFGLDFGDGKETVEEKVGQVPSASGRVKVPFPGKSESNWIKFRFECWELHVEFNSASCDSIRMVTIQKPRNLARLN